MKIPTVITTRTAISLTHGFISNFGTVNISLTVPIDRAKYFNGGSAIESLENVLPDFSTNIQDHTREL